MKGVQAVSEAFGRADAQAILDACSDDVDWATEAASTDAPWFGVRRGKEQNMDRHHFFRFGDGGKISCYRGSEDTAQSEAIFGS
jgi:ketosteroid isomerase-like protein